MPQTQSLVQRIKLDPDFTEGYWVYIGPSPTNTTLFVVGLRDEDPEVQRRSRMAEILTGALFARREVIVFHPEANNFEIFGVEVVPG
jgi:hypothetical protein